jgi:hypothetical protein
MVMLLFASWLIAAQFAVSAPSSSLPAAALQQPATGQQSPPAAPRPSTGQSPAQPPSQQGQTTATQSTDSQAVDDVVSIDRIRKALQRAPVLTFVMPDPNVPRFRVEISSSQFRPLTFQNSFYIPPTPAPVPFGGVDYYEMQRLNTPPEFWGSAPFTNKDLLGMAALNGAYSLLGALIKKGMEAHAIAEQARLHQEVEEELRALAAHNARVAAEQAEKKRQQEGKKEEVDRRR